MIDMDKLGFCNICSDKSIYRKTNEDCFVINDRMMSFGTDRFYESCPLLDGWNILGVFDGMGGTEHGEMASSLAAGVFADIKDAIRAGAGENDLDDMMREAFLKANNSIVKKTRYSGTTATVMVTDGKRSKLFHLGDSRAFLAHNGNIEQITKDQTVEEMKKGMGLFDSIVEADKHRLTEYLGADESMQGIVPLESGWIQFSAGDSFVLCTDGLYEGCSGQEILQAIGDTEPGKVASKLVEQALSRNVRDNVTCIYIH